jgi:hypothetical protein
MVEFVRGVGDAALADVTFNVVQRPYNSKHPVVRKYWELEWDRGRFNKNKDRRE